MRGVKLRQVPIRASGPWIINKLPWVINKLQQQNTKKDAQQILQPVRYLMSPHPDTLVFKPVAHDPMMKKRPPSSTKKVQTARL